MSDTAVETTVSAEPETPASPTLDVNDIRNAVAVIDYAQAQGAFKDWETLEQVLPIRKRLKEFLEALPQPEQTA